MHGNLSIFVKKTYNFLDPYFNFIPSLGWIHYFEAFIDIFTSFLNDIII